MSAGSGLRHSPAKKVWAALAVGGCALSFAPLVRLPGYELAEALTLLVGLGGAWLGAILAPRTWASVMRAWGAALSACLPALVIVAVRTALGPCGVSFGWGWLGLLPLPSALLAVVLGAAIARLTPQWSRRIGIWLLAVLGLTAVTVSTILFGPHIYAYHHLGGYLPGPLYDEALSIPTSLWWYRLATVLLAGALGEWLVGRPRTAVLALAGFLALEASGTSLGFRTTDTSLANALGEVHRTADVTLHHSAAMNEEAVREVMADVAFRHAQLSTFFGAPAGPVRVWWYPSGIAKQRWVGADSTQFAKPWRREIHVNAAAFPHPVLKHELAHALAQRFGRAPFGVTAQWFGLLPHVGLIEGLAVAADDAPDDLTLHQWAAAMKKKGQLPDVAALMTAQGFYSAPASRAYTTAGSFVQWVRATFGPKKLLMLYQAGDFEQSLGEPLVALAQRYQVFLDAVELNEADVNQAYARFRRGSLFDRPCGREVAALSRTANELVAERPDAALALYRQCAATQPDEPSHLTAQAALLAQRGQLREAQAVLTPLLAALETSPQSWADVALVAASLHIRLGEKQAAQTLLKRVEELDVSEALRRTAAVRRAGLDLSPKGQSAMAAYFQATAPEAVTLAGLAEAQEESPVRYLLARRRFQLGDTARAAEALSLLATEPSLPELGQREARRLAIEAWARLGRCDKAAELAAVDGGVAFAARAADWLARCRFPTLGGVIRVFEEIGP